jgi:hypothetical protein
MQFPTWLKPGLMGAGAGALAVAIAGFSWGGWVTGGSAQDMARKAAGVAVASALTPYCVERAGNAAAASVVTELKAAPAYSRKGIVEKAGWATPLGSDKPNTDLAQACQLKLAEAF